MFRYSEFENNLKLVSYPFNSTLNQLNPANQPSPSSQGNNQENKQAFLELKDKNEAKLRASARRLLQIEIPACLRVNQDETLEDKNTLYLNPKATTLIDLLVTPLAKRFRFHFFSNRKTNNPDKPEWYLSQILQWIRDQEPFITSNIQVVFEKIYELSNQSALIFYKPVAWTNQKKK